MRVSRVLAMVGGLAALACSGLGEDMSCYHLIEGQTETILRIDRAEPSVTVYERQGGTDIVPPLTTLGRMDGDDFVYADGTRLALTDATLTWPDSSLLQGAVFTTCGCP